MVAVAAGDGTITPLPGDKCNGSARLCDRPVDQVAFPATHNSMSSPASGFLFPDQQTSIPSQLEGGIRGLLIDTHYGVRTEQGRVHAARVGRQEPREDRGGGGAGRRPRRPSGCASGSATRAAGTREVYLCHGFCELGSDRAEPVLRGIRDFLVANPGEVLVISIEDQVTPEDTEAAFRDSGLLDLVWTDPIAPLPTLGEMVERNRRVLVFGEEETGGVPWYHQQFDFVKETPFDTPTVAELLSAGACVLNRGKLSNPLVLLNHWVAQTPAAAPAPRAR